MSQRMMMIGGPLAGQEVIAPETIEVWPVIETNEDNIQEIAGMYYQEHYNTEEGTGHYFLWQDTPNAMDELLAHYCP